MDSSREICIGTVYFTVVHDVSFVLYADGSDRHRFERRQKNLADYRSQYCGIPAELRPAVLAGSALGRTGRRNGECDFFLGIYAHQDRIVFKDVAEAALPENLYPYRTLPDFVPGLHLLWQHRQLLHFCFNLAGRFDCPDCEIQNTTFFSFISSERSSE